MNITAEEKLMYDVMKAVYDSGIPVNFKGSMVLKACLSEMGYAEETRHTVDIDANWNGNEPPTAENIANALQNAITKAGIDLRVNIYRMFGEGRSAGFELRQPDSGEILFTMDIDVNRPVPPTRIYEIAGVSFCGVSPLQMISDKLASISSEKVFRRIKDVVDLYYLSNVFVFDSAAVMEVLKNSGRTLDSFNGFLNRTEELEHSYDKFRFAGGVCKPPFTEVYRAVKTYIRDFLPK